jgi:hypothetical protein
MPMSSTKKRSPVKGCGGLRRSRGKKLQGNEALEARVFRLIDHSHPAAPESLEDAVVRNGLADHGNARPLWRPS